jgi:hypothetical protein
MNWNDNDENLSPDEQNTLSKYINKKLRKCLAIEITPYKDTSKYEIKQLFTLP